MCMHMQEPEVKPFGEEYYLVRFSGAKRRNGLKSDNFYDISILDTLKTLMALPEVQAEVLNPHTSGNSCQTLVMVQFSSFTQCSALIPMLFKSLAIMTRLRLSTLLDPL